MKNVVIALLLAVFMSPLMSSPGKVGPWPGDEWPSATPEEQGMDSARLAEMLDTIAKNETNIDSVLVLRNGHSVLDAYVAPVDPDMLHHVASVSKSFTATLVGIATGQGFIPGVETPLLDLFPGYEPAEPDPRRDAATLENLLTMSTGWNCHDSASSDGIEALWASPDWVQHMLDLPMIYDPGTHFEYCNGGSYLLGAAVEVAAGQSLADFAETYLFAPLGITDYQWNTAPDGRPLGYTGLQLRPRDMARLGYLYLHDGVWNDEQLVPADFITAARTPHIETGGIIAHYGYRSKTMARCICASSVATPTRP